MNKKIKLLLLSLGLGLFAAAAHADCDPCQQPNPPPTCNNDDDNNGGDSMPEGVIIDDMPTALFSDEAVEVIASTGPIPYAKAQ